MRRRLVAVVAAGALLTGALAAWAATQPDSLHQSVQDGCNRSSLGLLAEGQAHALATEAGVDVMHPTAFPDWVYVNGDRTPRTIRGGVLAVHTAGSDLQGVHDSYDLNVDVGLPKDSPYLSTRNAAENPPQIHTEWESRLAPVWAWPTPGDSVEETGSFIWDCGHWQIGSRKIPDSDNVPGDPLGTAGVEQIGGEEAEIHPIQELATWRHQGAFTPAGSTAAVDAGQLDVYISNQGGKAKAVEECALIAPAHPTAGAARIAAGEGCSEIQDIAYRDYSYELTPPDPRPSPGARLMVQEDDHGATHNLPAGFGPVVHVDQHTGVARITLPFKSFDHGKGVPPTTQLQDFGATWHAWWQGDTTPVDAFKVTLEDFTVENNLDADIGQPSKNPTITPPGEWNVYLDDSGHWVNLHDPIKGHTDLVPGLGAVPPHTDAFTPSFDLSGMTPSTIDLPAAGNFRMFVDARECDLPAYQDCPTNNELDFPQTPGRSEIVLPVSQLAGKTTYVLVHPVVCAPGASCPEENSDPTLCTTAKGTASPLGCHELRFRIDDLAGTASVQTIYGDGTATGTRILSGPPPAQLAAPSVGVPATSVPWWLGPLSAGGPDQDEELAVIRGIEEFLLGQSRP